MTNPSYARVETVRRLSISGHANGINRRNRTGKADGRDVVRRDGHGDDNALVEREALNGLRAAANATVAASKTRETNW